MGSVDGTAFVFMGPDGPLSDVEKAALGRSEGELRPVLYGECPRKEKEIRETFGPVDMLTLESPYHARFRMALNTRLYSPLAIDITYASPYHAAVAASYASAGTIVVTCT